MVLEMERAFAKSLIERIGKQDEDEEQEQEGFCIAFEKNPLARESIVSPWDRLEETARGLFFGMKIHLLCSKQHIHIIQEQAS